MNSSWLHLFCIDIPIQSISDDKSRISSLRSCNLEYIIIIIGHPIHCFGGIKYIGTKYSFPDFNNNFIFCTFLEVFNTAVVVQQ